MNFIENAIIMTLLRLALGCSMYSKITEREKSRIEYRLQRRKDI